MNDTVEIVPVGTVLDGKYRIDARISAGGMGVVYEATYLALNRKVAVKTLLPEYRRSPVVLERFRQEAKAAGSIKHDNICEVTDIGTLDNGIPYLVMPLLRGKPLSTFIEPSQMSFSEILDITRQVLSALQAVHDAGIVHRDLKPDNIFLIDMGDRHNFVKLLDFGVSKFPVDDGDEDSGLTQTREMLGTPYYMSPEQVTTAKTVDRRTDIYAVGVILYEMLTGRRPFLGDCYNEIIVNISIRTFPLPSKLNPRISPALEAVVMKAMARDPDERFAEATDMRLRIEMLTADEAGAGASSPTTVSPPSATVAAPDRTLSTRADMLRAPFLSSDGVSTDRGHGRLLAYGLSFFAVLITAVLAILFFLSKETARAHTARDPAPPRMDRAIPVEQGTTIPPTQVDGTVDTSTLGERAPSATDAPAEQRALPRTANSTSRAVPPAPKEKGSSPAVKRRTRPRPSKDTDKEGDEVISGKAGTLFFKDY